MHEVFCKAVIIGGGVVGASVLYHLAKIGWTDVVLLEKSELTSGSPGTRLAACTPSTVKRTSRGCRSTPSTFTRDRGTLRPVLRPAPERRLMLAATPGELDSLKLICSRARYLGMETEMITLDEAVELNPLIDRKHFIGALWRADGHCDPSGTTHAYVKAARKLGASVERFTRVLELNPGRRHWTSSPTRARCMPGTWSIARVVGTRSGQMVASNCRCSPWSTTTC